MTTPANAHPPAEGVMIPARAWVDAAPRRAFGECAVEFLVRLTQWVEATLRAAGETAPVSAVDRFRSDLAGGGSRVREVAAAARVTDTPPSAATGAASRLHARQEAPWT